MNPLLATYLDPEFYQEASDYEKGYAAGERDYHAGGGKGAQPGKSPGWQEGYKAGYAAAMRADNAKEEAQDNQTPWLSKHLASLKVADEDRQDVTDALKQIWNGLNTIHLRGGAGKYRKQLMAIDDKEGSKGNASFVEANRDKAAAFRKKGAAGQMRSQIARADAGGPPVPAGKKDLMAAKEFIKNAKKDENYDIFYDGSIDLKRAGFPDDVIDLFLQGYEKRTGDYRTGDKREAGSGWAGNDTPATMIADYENALDAAKDAATNLGGSLYASIPGGQTVRQHEKKLEKMLQELEAFRQAVLDHQSKSKKALKEAYLEAKQAGDNSPVPPRFTAAIEGLAQDRQMMANYYSKYGATTWGHAYEATAERIKEDLKLAQQFVQFAPKNGIDPVKYVAAMPRNGNGGKYLGNFKELLDWALEFVDFDFADWSQEDDPIIPSKSRPALRKPPL